MPQFPAGLTRRLSIVVCLTVLPVFTEIYPVEAGVISSRGTDFWLAFPQNAEAGTLTLLISSDKPTNGTITLSLESNNQIQFQVTAGGMTSIELPSPVALQLSSPNQVENRAIHISTQAEVTVQARNDIPGSVDSFLGIPTTALGNEYIVASYTPREISLGSQVAIVGTEPDTFVTIVPRTTVGVHPAGMPFTVHLDSGQSYFMQTANGGDLTGSFINSDKPVGVISGAQCAFVPWSPSYYGYCDHLVEQIPPVTAWGKSFITQPLASRAGGDTFRVIASKPNTTVAISGGGGTALTLPGDYHELILTSPAVISASEPVLVVQYANSSTYDSTTTITDPFMLLVPATEQFLSAYSVTVPNGTEKNYLNIVAPSAAAGQIKIDGVFIPAGSFTAVSGSGYSTLAYPVDPGPHRLEGISPFGVTVYGFDPDGSYGYPAGMAYGADNNGSDDLTVAIQALQVLAGFQPVGFELAGDDIGGDGKIGLEEAIETLKKASQQ